MRSGPPHKASPSECKKDSRTGLSHNNTSQFILNLFSIVTLLRFDHDLQDQLDHTEDLQDELSDV